MLCIVIDARLYAKRCVQSTVLIGYCFLIGVQAEYDTDKHCFYGPSLLCWSIFCVGI